MVAVVLAASGEVQSIRAWQKERDAKLRSPDGWLTLVGLFWLKDGDNTIGSAENNDFVLPKSAAAHVGTLRLERGKVTYRDAQGNTRTLSFDEKKPDVVKSGTVSFYLIRRGDKFGVRAKDSESPALRQFTGMRYFPVNPELRFEAKFIPDAKKIPILNILGQTEEQESPGVVEFSYQGQTYRLRPIYEDQTLFFLFKDATNRTETYQAGRMLNTPLPKNGKVELDFNRAYNPPCTFTPYATCPLPPKENTLPFAVNAGELRYGHGHPELTARR
ncbi:MAG TPA: DUF1684 domain-containing protein [Bryobacteraceae bacterium]|jgi:uncharacterized protein (DUF1684 family)|nr:DUF1684 domain-containing protein [Bryobacteraceae bacterium]